MKNVYLTVDDGPSIDRKKKVDILYERGIQALWFCIGTDMEKHPDDVLYTIAKGGIIGNHSYSHPHFSQITLEECFNEIEKTDKIIDKFYKEQGIPRPLKAFRFPYGDKGADNQYFTKSYSEEEISRITLIQNFLIENGYSQPKFDKITYDYYKKLGLIDSTDWYWTYDTMEWCTFQEKQTFGIRSIEDIFEVMELDLPEKWAGLNYEQSDDIIVIHDHPQTTPLFEPIIDKLISKGLIFNKIPMK